MQKVLLLIFTTFSISYGSIPISPVAKSFLLPGYGELKLGYEKSAKFFMRSEIILITTCFSLFKTSNIIENNYIAYAAEHSGATGTNDDRYWVDVGNYNTTDDFDYEHLRMRDAKEGQWSANPWDWKNDSYKRKKFENMRINSDKFSLAGKFLIGGIILNHIVSSINTMYILRLNDKTDISLKSETKNLNGGYAYVISLQF